MRVSPEKRRHILDALRRGTVPESSLDLFAVGLDHFQPTLDDEMKQVAGGHAVFKAVRGEYGCGKTFFARWLAERARRSGFVTSEIQVSETETPLNRLETVYRRLLEMLATSDTPKGALRNIIDGWFYTLEEDVLREGTVPPDDNQQLLERTSTLLEQRLATISQSAPMFAAALRGYLRARAAGDSATADGLLAWISGQPNVASSAKRCAGIKGDIDHFGAMNFLVGLLTVLRDSGKAGLLITLDEVETIQRVRSDARDKSLNAIRQLIDEIDAGRFPGLYLLVTGTPAFFDGPQGVHRLEPLAQRLHVDFKTDPRFDNPRAVQIRLTAFDHKRLVAVGTRIRNIFAEHSEASDRIRALCPDATVQKLAYEITGSLGGKVGIAPRIFLKKLVGDLLDRIEQFPEFDPQQHYQFTLSDTELTPAERSARNAESVDDIELEL